MGPDQESSDLERIDRLKASLLARESDADRALANLTEFTSDEAARALNRDRNTFSVYVKRGKVFAAKSGKLWKIPLHHVARYFEGLWADQWDVTVTDGGPKYNQRFPLLGGVTLAELAVKYSIEPDILQKAIDYGYLRSTVFGGLTYVYIDDFISFVRVNKGVWRVDRYYEDKEGVKHGRQSRYFPRLVDPLDVDFDDIGWDDDDPNIMSDDEVSSGGRSSCEPGESASGLGLKAVRVISVVFPLDPGYRLAELG